MRPVFSIALAGFTVATSLWAGRAHAGCAVDTDCLDNGLACGTDVCNRSGTCVAAGTDPGTCSSVSNCKCYGLYSVLCNPENHSCTITSADGGMNRGGGGESDGGSPYVPYGGDDGGGATGADDSGSAATDMDAATSQGGSGSTSGTSSAGESSGTLAASTGSGGNGASTGASSGASTSGQAASASGGSPPPAKSTSGCSLALGQAPAPVGLCGIAIGAWALLGRRLRIHRKAGRREDENSSDGSDRP
jgi:hypothetical protein